MDSLSDILSRKNLDQPDEITAIKDYVLAKYQASVSISLQPNNIVISAPSAGLISTLRMESPQIQQAAKTTKKLLFRIG